MRCDGMQLNTYTYTHTHIHYIYSTLYTIHSTLYIYILHSTFYIHIHIHIYIYIYMCTYGKHLPFLVVYPLAWARGPAIRPCCLRPLICWYWPTALHLRPGRRWSSDKSQWFRTISLILFLYVYYIKFCQWLHIIIYIYTCYKQCV